MFALTGTSIGRGIAIGRALIWDRSRSAIPNYRLQKHEINQEISRFSHAIALVRSELKHVQDNLPDSAPPETAAFIDVHLMMLDDPVLSEQPIASIAEHQINAEWSLQNHSDTLISFFDNISDPYLRTKREDVAQVVDRIMDILIRSDSDAHKLTDSVDQVLSDQIIVARDISPADAIMLRQRHLSAFVTSLGGPISHTAILARSLAIPAIVGLHDVTGLIRNNDYLIVDAASGALIVAPDDATLEFFKLARESQRRRQSELSKLRKVHPVTADGQPIKLLANIELPEDLDTFKDSGASGVGLYRTEFLFMNRENLPSEDEQYKAYCHVLQSV